MKISIKCLIILLLTILALVTCEPVTQVKCTCGFTLILFCPGAFQCWNACKDYKAWYTVCVLNEGNGNHYCECFGGKKTELAGQTSEQGLKYLK